MSRTLLVGDRRNRRGREERKDQERLRAHKAPLAAMLFTLSREGRSTTVVFLTRGSDLLPDGRERMDERRVDRGNIGAVGRIAVHYFPSPSVFNITRYDWLPT